MLSWKVNEIELTHRLIMGTACFPSLATLKQAIVKSQVEIITVSISRQAAHLQTAQTFWSEIQSIGCRVLPNTAGCHTISEVITMAEMSREIFNTNWIKLEIIGDAYNLQPNPLLLPAATDELVKRGFIVWPYCTDDLVLCQRLIDMGCSILMPWAAPIGTGQGLLNIYNLQVLRERFPGITLIIDAGIGKPSHACQAMEMGYDAVLVNSAIAKAQSPITMAQAFHHAVTAGYEAYQAGAMPCKTVAEPSTPLIDKPFWHQDAYHPTKIGSE